MPTASRDQRIDALRRAGWPEPLIPTAVAISIAEFGTGRDLLTQSQSDIVSNGVREPSYGPFQIHLPSHPDVSKECASDLYCSAAAALRIHDTRGNFSAWSTYNNGDYLRNLAGDGAQVGTVPTVQAGAHQSPDAAARNASPVSSGPGTFPSFDFPKFTLIPESPLTGHGVIFDTAIVFKLLLTLFILVFVFYGVMKLTGVSAPSLPKPTTPAVPTPETPAPSAPTTPPPAAVSASWTPEALAADRKRRKESRT